MLTVILAWHVSFPRTTSYTSGRDPSGCCLPLLPFLIPACSSIGLHPPHQSLLDWKRCTSLWEILLCVVQLGPNPISGDMCLWIKLVVHHPSSGSGLELSTTDWYTSSALAFCVRGGIFQCGGKSYSNHSFQVLRRVSLKCRKSPVK